MAPGDSEPAASPLFRPQTLQRFDAKLPQPPLLSRPISSALLGVFAAAAAAATLGFATSFEFARKEQAAGYLEPAAGWSRVTSSVGGTVGSRFVEPGDPVARGDVLFVIAPETGIARSRTVEREILEQLQGTRRLLEGRMRLLEEKHRLDQTLYARQSKADEHALERLRTQIEREQSRLATAARRLHDGRRLLAAGSLAASEVLALADQLNAQAVAVSERQEQADQLSVRIATADDRLRQLDMDAEGRRLALAERLQEIGMEESRLRAMEENRVLAPRAGVAASVRVRAGDQVRAGEPLLDILPTEGPLRARLLVSPSAMGFVAIGQEVRVRLDAFPQTEHGAQIGEVSAISGTASPAVDTRVGALAGGAVFRVRVRFPNGFDLPSEQRRALRPGMTVTADLIRERGTLLDWLIEPLRGAAARV